MTVEGWGIFAFLALIIVGGTAAAMYFIDSVGGKIASALVGMILLFGLLGGMLFYYNGTAAGRRDLKTQESNFNGGLTRTVTLYGYNGEQIQSWTGKFDVTENDQETYFDIDGRRVIIQGGIIVNEEKGASNES